MSIAAANLFGMHLLLAELMTSVIVVIEDLALPLAGLIDPPNPPPPIMFYWFRHARLVQQAEAMIV